MRDKGTFTFGSKCSQDYDVILTRPPSRIIAERDVEVISVAGRSGDLIQDNGRYKNVPLTYDCAVIPKNGKLFREAAEDIVSMLGSVSGYARLENSFYTESYRMARVSKQIDVESIVEKAGKFSINFDCKPQRFLVEGETPVEFSAPSTITNPTLFSAKPLIMVYGTGAGTLTVGDTTVEINTLEDQIALDCEIQDAYRQVGESAAENMNSCIYAPEFPELAPGENVVSWDGDITSVTITPRWWTL